MNSEVVSQRDDHEDHFKGQKREPEVWRILVDCQKVIHVSILAHYEDLRLKEALLDIVKQDHQHQQLRQADRIVFISRFLRELVKHMQHEWERDYKHDLNVLQDERNLQEV